MAVCSGQTSMNKPYFQLLPENASLLGEKMPTLTEGFESIQEFLPYMFTFMKAEGGMGLAAPQVGLKLNFFIMDTEGKKRCVINPIIAESSKARCTYPEGCLSFPNKHILISRPVQIIVMYQDEFGDFVTEPLDGFSARCFQHEFDHLQGRLFTEYEAG